MRSNLKMLAAASAIALVAAAQPAFAADFFPNTSGTAADGSSFSFTVTGDPFDGTVSGGIERTGLRAGTNQQDRYIFRLGQDGLGSGSITTTLAGVMNGVTDVDFLSASLFNGVTTFIVPLSGIGAFEFGNLTNIPIFNGNTNILTINYTARGNGSYGGNLSFVPVAAAVPEPATWALMLLGFAGIGFAMRRRTKQQVRVKYAF